MNGLDAYGWNQAWADALDRLGESTWWPARVVLEHGRFLRVHDGRAECLAVAAKKMRHDSGSSADRPTVGDWVAAKRGTGEDALVSIQKVLPRRTAFSRRRVGTRDEAQIVAANVDTAILMMGLDADYNLRRLERYLSVAHSSGARPVIALNKADLTPNLDERRAAVMQLAPLVPVVSMSLETADGHHAVESFLEPGHTVALLGSSGVGKSTLLNRLLGSDTQRTGGVREHDRRGRHTTSYAQLFVLPTGGLVIDTPGLRELQLWDAEEGVDATFDDVEALAAACRFRDCRHQEEPGCAVQLALQEGRLASDRFASFRKLHGELAIRARAALIKGRGRRR